MIIDYKSNPGHAKQFGVFDSATGECLDRECIFYADDEAGFYHRHLINDAGMKYVWDSRDRRILTGTFANPRNPVPDEFKEVAWERVDRAITIKPREASS